MMKRRFYIFALPFCLVFTELRATRDPERHISDAMRKSQLQEWKLFDVNNILCTINSAGPYADYLRTNSAGLFWPKGSPKSAVFSSGLWIVGQHRPTGSIRTAVQHYQTEFQPGPIQGVYNTTLNNSDSLPDPHSTQYRLYKINKKDTIGGTNPDYVDWPGDLGAPYIDINKDGRWTKGIDKPKFFGDQQLWTVYNDGNPFAHQSVGMTPPMGMEVRALFYGFYSLNSLQNIMFIRFTIINKSDAVYDSLFFGLWSDTDLGNGSDDYVGYDSTLRLSYFYNGDNSDDGINGYGNLPPANGYAFLKSTPAMTPFANSVMIGGGVWPDPSQGNSMYPLQAYNYMKGLRATGDPYFNPLTMKPDKFVFSGDPVTGTGWTPSLSGLTPGDYRSVLSIGPAECSPGDTVVIDAAFVIAQGTDRLASISRLREATSFAQNFHRMNLTYPAVTARQTFMPNDVHLHLSMDASSIGLQNVTAEVVQENSNTILATVPLNDSGVDGDLTAGDKIFSRNITLPRSPEPVRINAIVSDSLQWNTRWNSLHTGFPMSTLKIGEPVIVSDDLNRNGVANPGENVRITLSAINTNNFDLHGVSVNFAPLFDTIRAQSGKRPEYSPLKGNSFLEVSVPKDFRESNIRMELWITDNRKNVWFDTVTLPVVPLTYRTTAAQRLSGRGGFTFDIHVTDKSVIKNNIYEILGVDSAKKFYGLQINNRTTGETVLPPLRLVNLLPTSQNHLLPIIDGFKISVRSFADRLTVNQKYEGVGTQWFNYLLLTPEYISPVPSAVHPADIPNTVIKFNRRTGFTDTNNNGILDNMEPYSFDTSLTDRTQKAFLYNLGGRRFLGFVDVPFAVYDVTSDPPKQLTVVLQRSNILHQAPRWSFSGDIIIVTDSVYRSDGIMFDSTKGGKNLLPVLLAKDTLSFYYSLSLSSTSNQLSDTGNFRITVASPFSSRDTFIFNPSEFRIETEAVPTTTELFQNYPNPFNPSTTIRYSVPQQGVTTIVIYNALGQKVKTLLDRDRPAGTFEIDWNGRNDDNVPVASGLYIYRIISAGVTVTKKMILLK